MDPTIKPKLPATGPLKLPAGTGPLTPPGQTAPGPLPSAGPADRVNVTDARKAQAVASLSLVGEAAGISLPVPTSEIDRMIAGFVEKATIEHTQDLLTALEAYAAADPKPSIDALSDEITINVPERHRGQLTEVLTALRAETAIRELYMLAGNPETRDQALVLLASLDRIMAAGKGADTIAGERKQLSPDLRGRFDALGLARDPARLHAGTRQLAVSLQRFEGALDFSSTVGNLQKGFDELGIQETLARSPLGIVFPDKGEPAAGKLDVRQNAETLLQLEISNQRSYRFQQSAGMEYDSQRQAYVKKGNPLEGIHGMLASAQNIDAGTADLIRQMIQYGSERGLGTATPDFSEFKPKDLKLNEGQVAIALRMFQKSAELSELIPLLTHVWDKESSAGLSPAEIEKLKDFGIGFDSSGNPLNVVSGAALDHVQIAALKALGTQISASSIQSGNASNRAAGMTTNWVNSFLESTGTALKLEAEIRQGNERIETLRGQARNSQGRIRQSGDQVTQTESDYRRVAQSNRQLQQKLAPFMQNGQIDVERAAREGKLGELNAFLAEFGLSLEQTADGEVIYRIRGQQVNHEAFDHRLETDLATRQNQEAILARNLADARQRLEQDVQEGERIKTELAAELRRQEERLAAFKSEMENGMPASEMRTRLQDPAFRSQFSPEQLTQIEQMLSERERLEREAPGLIQETQAQIDAGHQDLTALSQEIARGHEISQSAAAALTGYQPGLSAELERRSQELIDAADQLEARLNLSPRPDLSEATKMMEKWHQSLEK
ncbi:MAG: hypothetical protein ACAI44_33400, partial [Candidatus Sericytochromatia bacterium]